MSKIHQRTLSGLIFLFVCITLGYGQNGIVVTERSSPPGVVSFSASSTLTGVSNTKHVDGYVKKYGATHFTFPVGDNGIYRPFAAEADGTVGAYFKIDPGAATLPSGAPFSTASKETGIKNVSNKEYWDVDGTNPSKLSFTWDASSDIATLTEQSLENLALVGWSTSTSKWEIITSTVDEVALLSGPSSLSKGSISTVGKIVPNQYRAYTFAALNVANVAASYEGEFETAGCSEIAGWAWDKNHPEAALTLELVVGGTVHATFVASNSRSDLASAGKGTGKYGFRVQVPSNLMNGEGQELSVRVRSSTYVLTGSPKTINCSYAGTFETADCGNIVGWMQDKNNPNAALEFEIVEGTTVHGSGIANIYRADLKNAGIGTGKYGFNIALPLSLKDGKNHQLRIRIKGKSYLITGSKSITCSASQFDGYAYADCQKLYGWAWDRIYPETAMTIEVYEGTTIYATVVANAFRQDLQDGGIGTANYGYSVPLPAALKDGKTHELSARIKGTSFVLKNSPRTLTCAVPSSHAGMLESADCNTIQGFAWDQSYPDKAVVVELMEGTKIWATDTADIYRSDLEQAGTGTGKYGFSFNLPSALRDAKAHALSVRIKGTSIILGGSPKNVTCALPALYGGGFDFLSCATIKGWAWNKNYPDQALTVEIMEGSTVIATVLANKYREDIKTRGFGTGIYGFEIPLPASLKDGAAHILSVRVKGTTYIVPGSPRSVTCAVPTAYAGTLESADCNFIKGFAWDKNYPAKVLTVEVMEGSTILATVIADTYRADLKTAGVGTGNYGFSIPAPAILKDGATHAVSVRIKGTSTILTGSPKSVNCALPASYGGGFDFLSCATIKGWAWNKNYPDQALTVEIMEGSTVIATVLANKYREDIKTRGFGTGIYGFEIPLPASLKDGAAHILSVRVKGTTYIVPGSPRSVTCAVPTAYAGTLESADCNFIKGFAWDKNYPAKVLTVEVMEGSTILATVIADTYRADLKTAGMGTGNYGFSIPAPAILKDGATHAVSVRIKGTSTILTGSPKSVNCSLPALYGGGFDYLSCATIKGWAWDKNYPEKTMTLEIIEGTTVFGTVTASLYREDIKNKGFGTGNYGFNLSTPIAMKDGKTHSISLRVKGTSYIVPGSPRAVTCASPARIAVVEEVELQPGNELEYAEITVSPNPTDGQVVASFYLGKSKHANLSVTNMLGQTVWQKSDTGAGKTIQESIDLRQQVSGMYIFMIKTEGKTQTRRIVLTK
ncbi:hypothetical protein DYBT9623_03935 [Dyadobacter sp. CECT 9623]|uniref:Secretion system C-terminal sorting domain-containing protein n=1 Tax=Dyadobacter linearis TaxID=2823330 RepID=A0ABN7RDB0_9BACT|nr:T9SS type A sorting domain-containing protein [Dyadobacter sp. CECT 9623]CAG5071995.1 hypothetical protein DYBT9623_03935 [Dyadobacter sp. CECT 9623]